MLCVLFVIVWYSVPVITRRNCHELSDLVHLHEGYAEFRASAGGEPGCLRYHMPESVGTLIQAQQKRLLRYLSSLAHKTCHLHTDLVKLVLRSGHLRRCRMQVGHFQQFTGNRTAGQ